MKKTIVVLCAFLILFSVAAASGQSFSSVRSDSSAAARSGSYGFIQSPQVTTMKDSISVTKPAPAPSLQKQAQTIQLISNLMKTLNDTTKAVIRNIGG
jgi:hypothetical protein